MLLNRKIVNYFNFLWEMTKKEIKVRYKNAFLGFLWIFLNPLLQMAIIGFIFQNFIKIPIANYYLFIFTGLLPWNFFSYSLNKATPSIVYERNLIQKANFPREAIPLSIVFSNFFHFLVSLGLLLIFLLISGHLPTLNLTADALNLILSVLWILSFTSGFSLLSSSLNVRYRDINFFVQALIILWFYATPVIYSVQILPDKYLSLFKLNPLVYPFEMFRSSLLHSAIPPNDILFGNLLVSFILVSFGMAYFKRVNQTFSDWL